VLKISIVAPSGSGKSTAADFMVNRFKHHRLEAAVYKLAEPLYEIQSYIYEKANKDISFYEQDQGLLELIANQLRRINPHSVVEDFMKRITHAKEDVIINDDLRDYETDFPELKKAGFIFLKIVASEEVRNIRLEERKDLNSQKNTKLNESIHQIPHDYLITNNSNQIEVYKESVIALVDRLVASHHNPQDEHKQQRQGMKYTAGVL